MERVTPEVEKQVNAAVQLEVVEGLPEGLAVEPVSKLISRRERLQPLLT